MADDDAEKLNAEERLRAAVAEWERCVDVRDQLHQAIVTALRAGVRPRDVAAIAPYDRNHIRRIADAAGVPPLKEPTVRPRDKES